MLLLVLSKVDCFYQAVQTLSGCVRLAAVRIKVVQDIWLEQKVIDIVKTRRAAAVSALGAIGTDGVEVSLNTVRKHYTKTQLETEAYAKVGHDELGSASGGRFDVQAKRE